jgi:hypothetical protein
MDGLTLLRQAREAGLAVAFDGDRLVIRGPKRAEPVARLLIQNKPEVVAALAEPADWRTRHHEALAYWGALHPADETARLAWGELQNRWHRLHGEKVPEWQCAGCDEPIGGLPALDLGDGNREHLDRLDCVIRYGARWRGAATRALVYIGLQPPIDGDTP